MHRGITTISFYAVDLVLDDLRKVNDALLDVTSKWDMLGLQLEIHPGLLDTIETKYPKDPSKCLLEMLKDWLKNGQATWEHLIEALESRALRESALARKLRDEYAIGKHQSHNQLL